MKKILILTLLTLITAFVPTRGADIFNRVEAISTEKALKEASVEQTETETETETEIKTISEIGNATIAGNGAYYDDGMLKYANSGNTIGYKFDQSNTMLEFDIIFDYIKFPGWFSLTFKASGFDRTQSANLEQKGYSFIVYPTGKVEVKKPNLQTAITGNIKNFSTGVKYRFKIGAINQDSDVKLFLSVNETEIINCLDETNAYLEGYFFNICGEGGTSARLFSTKQEIIPTYHTYTLSTIGDYPSCTATGATYDKNKNITLHGGTVGWRQGLQNYSVEVNMNWSEFKNGSNVWVGMRVGGFNRANSPALKQKGYVVRIGRVGTIELYKEGTRVTNGSWKYVENTDFVFEFGCVDLDSNRTMVFVNLNGKPVVSMIDDNAPIQTSGMFNINGDGSLTCYITSANTKLTPLVTKVNETQNTYVVETYFKNTLSYSDMIYSDFSEVLLNAIWVNGVSVSDINSGFYSLADDNKIKAIDVNYVNNKLVLTINKMWYNTSNNNLSQVEFSNLMLKKTGTDSGLICPSGFSLKQTYIYSV